ncbi:hypothetical protein ATANTOWER_022822, partial [Ataeniobius toweri]|nr:hypothetical protein [Ataeniobius toweri]
GAEFICGAALGQQGQAQFVAVPEDSMPELLRQCHHMLEESPGARLAVDACHCGCRCFCGSRLCNKFSSSFQHVIHTHSAIYFPSQVNTGTLCYGSIAVY